MTTTVGAYVARTQIGSLLARISEHRDRFVITKSGRPAAVLPSVRDFDDILEELDPVFRKTLRSAAEEHRRGQSITLQDFVRERPSGRRRRRAVPGRFTVHPTPSFRRELESLPPRDRDGILQASSRLEGRPKGLDPKIKKLRGKGIGR